jgi:hypothetical protein
VYIANAPAVGLVVCLLTPSVGRSVRDSRSEEQQQQQQQQSAECTEAIAAVAVVAAAAAPRTRDGGFFASSNVGS